MERKTTRAPTLFYCCITTCVLLSFFVLLLCTIGTRSVSIKESNNHLQGIDVHGVRRYLSGIGSYPPRCKSKCGRCTPCKPIHVPVPPGTSEPTEYYPEAWRCKCGNKLYMP